MHEGRREARFLRARQEGFEPEPSYCRTLFAKAQEHCKLVATRDEIRGYPDQVDGLRRVEPACAAIPGDAADPIAEAGEPRASCPCDLGDALARAGRTLG